ncbi:glycogen synthase GlgA [Pulveribacter suum]|uniref:Glycogen synthase n=1 Tax=Pulveribacter suum TaxID=2116657 RepID=A0A2P1NLA1_9BURK|nr:glycogen synthase GlgA [Pulveribacter suum]AVP57834.1 glycogen synthase GlgA [Pulveribacter suum]
MKLLFATPECAPLVKTGGLGDVSAALPAALAALGHDVRVLMPAYGALEQSAGRLLALHHVPADGPWPEAQLLHLKHDAGIEFLLLCCPQLYGRPGGPYGAAGGDHVDNALRFALLARVAALIGSRATPCGWQADVVHTHDWTCGLAPLYLHQARAAGDASCARSVLTLHNLAFQGVFPMELAGALGIAPQHRGVEGVEFWGQLSMLKAGLQFADAITTVSPTYAREIQGEALGFGLDGVLRSRADVLTGILNGIDTAVWNPATDALIAARYDAASLERKAHNRAALRQRCGLGAHAPGPLFGLVGRLTRQKGVDLVLAGAERLLAHGAQLVVLGSGDADLEQGLAALAARRPGRVYAALGFDEPLAHQIEAGADCFLMPSRFEPCGLNQMYSQAYGTPPIVTDTGGLADSVVDAQLQGGTGFVMPEATQAAFDDAVQRACATWRSAGRWRQLQLAGMRRDFGWAQPARTYEAVYERVLAADDGDSAGEAALRRI